MESHGYLASRELESSGAHGARTVNLMKPPRRLRIVLCYGTRPQTIKASVLRRALGGLGEVTAVDTGQHYDFALGAQLYQQLQVAQPDHYLEVGSGSHAVQTGAILQRAEALIDQIRPDAVVVIGDTNSTLGCALAAAKLRVPVAHVEAGLRAADPLMPEELNRRITDSFAGLLCAPSLTAARRLESERPDARISFTGDVARDVLMTQQDRLPLPANVSAAARAPFLYATLHRAELTSRPALLTSILESLGQLPVRVVLALHPRTRDALASAGTPPAEGGNLRIVPAVGYLESLSLAANAAAIVTDSGGLQREAYWLGVPCITMRSETEWTETVALGANELLPPGDASGMLASVVDRAMSGAREWDRDVYGGGDAGERIASAVTAWLA